MFVLFCVFFLIVFSLVCRVFRFGILFAWVGVGGVSEVVLGNSIHSSASITLFFFVLATTRSIILYYIFVCLLCVCF